MPKKSPKAESPKAIALEKLMRQLDENPLPLTHDLEEIIVDEYLYDYAYHEYSGKHLHDWVYRYLPRFLVWWADQKGLDTIDLGDMGNLRRGDGERFSRYVSDSKTVHTQINSALSAFGKWLLHEQYAIYNPFSGIKLKKSRVKKRPPIYSFDVLRRIFDGISRISRAPKGKTAADVKRQYNLFTRFLLQSGLRYEHALGFRCGDLECVRTEVSALFGYKYCVIASIEAVEEHKEAIGEELRKKLPASEIYIDMHLYNDLIDWCEHMGLGPDDRIMPITVGSLRSQGEAIRNRTGLPKFSWSIRHTWASVLYAMVGDMGLPTLVKFGGWESASMPLVHYVEMMKPGDAYRIAKEYRIYLPPEYVDHYGTIERRVQELEQPASSEMLEEIRALRLEVAKMKEERR